MLSFHSQLLRHRFHLLWLKPGKPVAAMQSGCILQGYHVLGMLQGIFMYFTVGIIELYFHMTPSILMELD